MNKNYKNIQQGMTELNSDGNETRGRYGEDYESQDPWKDEDLPPAEQERKRQAQDPRNG